jgi:hypothetical protein
MAKRKAKGRTTVWVPEPDDAIRLAALRWFALELERIGIQIYATDKRKYAAMERLFRQTVKRLGAMHDTVNVANEGDCPEGYVLCKDNTCAPMCDGIITANNES